MTVKSVHLEGYDFSLSNVGTSNRSIFSLFMQDFRVENVRCAADYYAEDSLKVGHSSQISATMCGSAGGAFTLPTCLKTSRACLPPAGTELTYESDNVTIETMSLASYDMSQTVASMSLNLHSFKFVARCGPNFMNGNGIKAGDVVATCSGDGQQVALSPCVDACNMDGFFEDTSHGHHYGAQNLKTHGYWEAGNYNFPGCVVNSASVLASLTRVQPVFCANHTSYDYSAAMQFIYMRSITVLGVACAAISHQCCYFSSYLPAYLQVWDRWASENYNRPEDSSTPSSVSTDVISAVLISVILGILGSVEYLLFYERTMVAKGLN